MTIALSTTISMFLSRIDNLTYPSIGTIHVLRVEAYEGDIKLENQTKYIDWGTVYPGTLTNRSIYIRSKSNIETILNLTTANWTFRDSDDKNVTGFLASYMKPALAMNLTWNYTDTPISPDEEIYVTLTLRASDDIPFINYLTDKKVAGFSFDIHIRAEE